MYRPIGLNIGPIGHCYLITWFTGPPTLAKKGRQKNKIALAHYILSLADFYFIYFLPDPKYLYPKKICKPSNQITVA